jgi:uncharacterized protein HemX
VRGGRIPVALASLLLVGVIFFAGSASASPTQDGSNVDPSETTTTLSPDGDVGRIIPLPNSGSEPNSPSDRGGWQQITLMVAIVAVIIGMSVWVWWRARKIRAKRSAAGLDPVDVARAKGADVRSPSPKNP